MSRLGFIFKEIMEYVKSLHFDDTHWLKLKPSGGIFFRSDLKSKSLEFILEVGIKVEIEVHPSGKKCDCLDCLVQVASFKVWYPKTREPIVYKWEFGKPSKLKKEDSEWINNVELLKSLEIVLEDAISSFSI
ncbi:hypothetical protein [Archaeoglobus sp.]